jgi:hypothetical protein
MKPIHTLGLTALLVAACMGSTVQPASATSMLHRNIVDLIEISELIVTGTVVNISDGFGNGVPYTEVTVEVEESIKGNVPDIYSFRQFGLLEPRSVGNGLRYLGVSPDGWPRFETGEEVLLFLYKEASETGLRTTVGLFQGKFQKVNKQYENGIRNRGLFQDVSVGAGLLTPAEERMLEARGGPVRAATLTSFVRKAVRGRWVEERKLRHVD